MKFFAVLCMLFARVHVHAHTLMSCQWKVVNTAASHGRVALVLETLVRGVWEQTDMEVEKDADEKNDDVE